ncbi:hypothetical protein J1N09_11630 [Aureitalea sp. L0-47]|uniref:hypothetical protein n=1 Tax=Aureitalea sp. L0-47 TaxID=2816962 RepID=UPI00223788A0|nr:hypothetical protein [Aureitalea sp. L0-47]MCW5520495.1 hypothetical protein [Aureitalea sp. L0-47]
MKNLLIISLFITAFVQTTIAQEIKTDSTATGSESYALFNLSTPFDFISPRLRVGYIWGMSEKWKVGLAAGYGFSGYSLFVSSNNEGSDYQFWEIRPQLFLFTHPKKKSKPYVSAEFFYMDHNQTLDSDFYYPEESSEFVVRYERIDYNRKKYGLNIKGGGMIPIFKDFGINIYGGIGFRVRDVSFSNAIDPRFELNDIEDELGFFEAFRREEGTVVGFNFSFGFNIYYRIGDRQ